jgi:type II secretory pathway pseudopilin PulG
MNKNKLSTLNKNFTPELDHHLLQGRRSRPLGRALPTLKKRWNSSSQIEGFTIIEVVLVLAIAGLIFLMVFIALPALQRSQRNAQYKNNLSVVVGLLQNYKSNNRGQYPPDDPSVDTGIMVGIARHTDHPFYRYVQESGLQDRTRVAIRTLGGGEHNANYWWSEIGCWTDCYT